MKTDAINLDDLSSQDLVRLAKVGLTAVIDELTGFQDVRFKQDKPLARMFENLKKE